MNTTAITNVRLFDGSTAHPPTTVLIHGHSIRAIDAPIPADATVIDGTNHTLLPGLIDAHVHTKEPQLGLALQFGVTTELEMMGHWTPEARRAVAENDALADLRTADFGMTAPGGHPAELHKRIPASMRGGPPAGGESGSGPSRGEPGPGGSPPGGHAHNHPHPPPRIKPPTVSSPEEAVSFVGDRVASGADYIKFMIEEGTVVGDPGLPLLSNETLVAGVKAAHDHGKLAIAHAMTHESTTQALNAGMDGLAHLFVDGRATAEIVELFKEKGAFVTPCAVLNASFMKIRPSILDDERVTTLLPAPWLETLQGSFDCWNGDMADVLGSIKALHDAGIDVLVGTDVSVPAPALGGLAHGASVHHELQLFVEAGLTPVEALRAATSVTARRFGLDDRGEIKVGRRADLLLVEGDPTRDIRDTLNIRGVWRRGTRVEM